MTENEAMQDCVAGMLHPMGASARTISSEKLTSSVASRKNSKE